MATMTRETKESYQRHLVDRIQNRVAESLGRYIYYNTGVEATATEVMVTKEVIGRVLNIYLKTNGCKAQKINYSTILGVDAHKCMHVLDAINEFEDAGYFNKLYFDAGIGAKSVTRYSLLIKGVNGYYIELHYRARETMLDVYKKLKENPTKEEVDKQIAANGGLGSIEISKQSITNRRGKRQIRYISYQEEVVEYYKTDIEYK